MNALRIFAQMSEFRCFHETKQTQNEVGRFFYNLAEFVFEYFCDSGRILATFAKFCLNSLFATWSYRYPNPKHVIQRALNLPSIFHTCFFDTTKLYKHLPLFAVFLALTRSPNLRRKTTCRELIPEAFWQDFAITIGRRGNIL